MERLTKWFGYGDCRVAGIASHLEEKHTAEELVDILATCLAAYEDTGLTPEDLRSNVDIDYVRIVELLKAEAEGRLVVLPFKCYIYCTKTDKPISICTHNSHDYTCGKTYRYSGGAEVIGEFVCDYILGHCEMANADISEAQSLVRREKILEYANEKEVFGWHISDLVIYDKPKMLGDFYVEKDATTDYPMLVKMKRPPQSWCYVEEWAGGGAHD